MSNVDSFSSLGTSRPTTWQPIVLPEIGAGELSVRVSSWLTELGEEILAGEAVVEMLIKGMTFDVEAPVSGTLRRIDCFENHSVVASEVLGWIEPGRDNDENTPGVESQEPRA